MKNINTKKYLRGKIFPVIFWTLLLLWCVILLLMFFWAVLTSFKGKLAFAENPLGFPSIWEFKNYSTAIKYIYTYIKIDGKIVKVGFVRMLINSLAYGLGASFFAVITAAMSSYVVAKYKQFKWVSALFLITIITTYIPITPSLAATLTLLKGLKLYDSMIGIYIFNSGAFGMMFLIYYATFKSVPWAFAESARMDGASHAEIFFKFMLPLTKTTFGALFITSFIGIWNDYMTPMIYMPSYPTIAYGAWIFQYSAESAVSSITVKLAGLIIVILPTFVLFLIFKNKIFGALTIGGLKE